MLKMFETVAKRHGEAIARFAPGFALVGVGRFFEHRGQFGVAQTAYERMSRRNHGTESEVLLGNLHYRTGDYRRASEHFERAFRAGRLSAVYADRFLTSLVSSGYDASVLKTSPDPEMLRTYHLKLADQFEGRGQRWHALESYSQAHLLGVSPRSASGIARCADVLDEEWRVLLKYEDAFDGGFDEPNWMRKYANLLEKNGRLDAAYQVLMRLIAGGGSSAWIEYRAGRLAEDLENREAALTHYANAIGADARRDAAKFGIGVFHVEAGRPLRAARAFAETALHSAQPHVRAELAYRAGINFQAALELEMAIIWLERALQLRPNRPHTAAQLGVSLELSGAYGRAAEFYGLARALGYKQREDVQFRRAICLARSGKHAEGCAVILDQAQAARQTDLDSSSLLQRDAFGEIGRFFAYSPWSPNDAAGYAYWAELSELAGDTLLAIRLYQRSLDMGSATYPFEPAAKLARLLLSADRAQEAFGVLLQTRSVISARPYHAKLPTKSGEVLRSMSYVDMVENLEIRQDVILYESNLGLSVDCNPLAIYRHIRDRFPGSHLHVWAVDGDVSIPSDVSADENVLIVRKMSPEYVKFLATAGRLVNNSTFPTFFSRRDDQHYLMTWHGTPLKTLGKAVPAPLTHANMARNFLQASLVCFPNLHTEEVLLGGCDVRGLLTAEVLQSGYPRNDALVSAAGDSTKNARRSALFAPTWRPDGQIEEQVELARDVVDALRSAGYEAMVRAHHYVEAAIRRIDPTLPLVDRVIPTNDLLPVVDLLVTDYSSIFFDFAVSGRPIVFFAPDWDRYMRERGGYFEQNELPGTFCSTIDQLRIELMNPVADPVQRAAFISRFAPHDDGNATEKVVERLLAPASESLSAGLEAPDAPRRKRRILIRQSLIPNGMASSCSNLVSQLPQLEYDVTILTDAAAVKKERGREATMRGLPEHVRILGRVGRQVASALEHHAMHVAKKDPGESLGACRPFVRAAFEREARRISGRVEFDASVEFDGYSAFMAEVVLGHGSRSQTTALYLHNDFPREIVTRAAGLIDVSRLMPEFSAVVAVSEDMMNVNAKGLSDLVGISTSNFCWANNVIDPDRLRTLAAAPLEDDVEAFYRSRSEVVVSLGRLSPEKNQVALLDAFAELLKFRPGVGLCIFGSGPLDQDLRAHASALGILDDVLFAGHRHNPYGALSKAACLAMSSLHEGQPMVILESMTLGVPVVSTLIAGTSALEGVHGVSLCGSAPSEMAEMIRPHLEGVGDKPQFDAEEYVRRSVSQFEHAVFRKPVAPV